MSVRALAKWNHTIVGHCLKRTHTIGSVEETTTVTCDLRVVGQPVEVTSGALDGYERTVVIFTKYSNKSSRANFIPPSATTRELSVRV